MASTNRIAAESLWRLTYDGYRVQLAGETFRQPNGSYLWTVSRYTEDAKGELIRQDVLRFGKAKNDHACRSIIARLCKKLQREGALTE